MSIDFRSLSLFKIIALVLVLLCFIMLFLPWLSASYHAYGETGSQKGNVFSTAVKDFAREVEWKDDGFGSFWSVMLIIFAIFAILAILLAVFGILTDRSAFVLPLAALAVLMFLFALFQAVHMKSAMKAEMGSYASMFSEFFTVRAGIGAWLFLVFGLGAYGLMFYEDRINGRNSFDFAGQLSGVSLPKVNAGGMGGLGGWTCTTCGARNGASQNFCTSCGSKKPEPPRCPNCGKLLKPGEAFCSNCGTRL